MGLNEAETRAKLIDPAIHKRGWTEELIRREETAGGIEVVDGKPRRRPKGRTDYTLRIRVRPDTQAVAVALIEAKKEDLQPGHGLDQGKAYAASKRLNVPFVFSSNGHLFVEYDRFTGLTATPRPIAEFPTPAELRARYEHHMGFSLDDEAARPLLTPYKGGEAQRRYYQDAAIRAVLEKVAIAEVTHQPPRALLSLATGAGKTFIAVNLLKRIADAGQMRRALFVCDRDELRTQGIQAMQDVFGSDAAEVKRGPNGENEARNARIHVATYQTLGVDDDEPGTDLSFLLKHYPDNFFSHIVIDECHRSAWGKWSEVLKRNPDAVQVGLTATPRRLKYEKTAESKEDQRLTADNRAYFGEPVYEYDMAQAIEDGYLAACVIQKGRVNVDDTGISIEDIMSRNPKDARTGKPLSVQEVRKRYESNQFEDKLLLPDRVMAMCGDLFNYLLETGGPEQKTVIFCARDRHADDVAATLNNLYAQWCQANSHERAEPYAFKCTAASSGNDQLPDFRASSRSHFIATTVDLLTTGVDVPVIQNVVFFKYVKSPISFYQMVGRGTRLNPATAKLMFTVYDYTNATRLFGEEFITVPAGETKEGEGDPPPPEPTVIVDGFEISIRPEGRFVVTMVDGKAMPVPVEQYERDLAERLVREAPTLDDFRYRWIHPTARQEMLDTLVTAGFSPSVLRMLKDMNDFDLYDVLADLGYGLLPRTREERAYAFRFKHEEWLHGLPDAARKALIAVTMQFARAGTEGLENPLLFQTPEVSKAGGLAALRTAGDPKNVLQETKKRMFAA